MRRGRQALSTHWPRSLLRRNVQHTLVKPAAHLYLRAKAASHNGELAVNRISVINLAARRDRLTVFSSYADALDLRWDRFDAIRHEQPIVGCNLSHAAVLRQVGDERVVMVCEDDAIFNVTRAEIAVLVDAFLADREAEVACLAFHLQTCPRPRNGLFFRVGYSRTTACYLVKPTIANDLADAFEHGAEELMKGGDRRLFSLDCAWRDLQERRVFLVPAVRAVVQADGWSDIEGQFMRYGV